MVVYRAIRQPQICHLLKFVWEYVICRYPDASQKRHRVPFAEQAFSQANDTKKRQSKENKSIAQEKHRQPGFAVKYL